jgi:hypothetical protein
MLFIQTQGSASASSQDTFNAWSSAKNKLQDHSVEQVLSITCTCLHMRAPQRMFVHRLHQQAAA